MRQIDRERDRKKRKLRQTERQIDRGRDRKKIQIRQTERQKEEDTDKTDGETERRR